ncbi:MAG: zinc ribbon domain-containing protein [uncultured Clostridium sp.]
MDKLIVYKCFECGHYTISKKDGLRCQKCKGVLNPMGHANYADGSNSSLKVEVSIKDTELFKKMVKVFKALIDDKHTPNWIKKKIREHILEEI